MMQEELSELFFLGGEIRVHLIFSSTNRGNKKVSRTSEELSSVNSFSAYDWPHSTNKS